MREGAERLAAFGFGRPFDLNQGSQGFAIREHPLHVARSATSPRATQGRLETKGFEGAARPTSTGINLPFLIEDHERQ
jgi:hypothetical protein